MEGDGRADHAPAERHVGRHRRLADAGAAGPLEPRAIRRLLGAGVERELRRAKDAFGKAMIYQQFHENVQEMLEAKAKGPPLPWYARP